MVGPDRMRVSGKDLGELCRRHRIRRLSLFGSVLREDFSPASDVDVLVEAEAGARVTFFSLARLEAALSALFGRRAPKVAPAPYERSRIRLRWRNQMARASALIAEARGPRPTIQHLTLLLETPQFKI